MMLYITTKHTDQKSVPSEPDEWLEQFNTFSIYQILPQLIDLWGLNVAKQVESKQNFDQVSGKCPPLFMLRCVQLGISIRDLELLTIGMVEEMFIERRNNEVKYAVKASQADMDRF